MEISNPVAATLPLTSKVGTLNDHVVSLYELHYFIIYMGISRGL